MASLLSPEAQKRSELIKQQFAAAKTRLGGQRRETERQSKMGLNRLSALSGQTGGAIEKARQKQMREIGRTFGEAEAGVTAGESAAQQQLLAEESAKKFQTAERLGSQEFAASEAEKTRALQGKQLDIMVDQFNREFTENQRTNFINTAMALQESGLAARNDWARLFGTPEGGPGPLQFLFGERNLPTIRGTTYSPTLGRRT